MIVLETRVFTRLIDGLLDPEEFREFQLELVARPMAGSLIQGTGGLRKIRWAGSSRGKRGGIRVIYYYHSPTQRILLLFAFAKNERSDLTPQQRILLRRIVAEPNWQKQRRFWTELIDARL